MLCAIGGVKSGSDEVQARGIMMEIQMEEER